jgi:hypothetical protein
MKRTHEANAWNEYHRPPWLPSSLPPWLLLAGRVVHEAIDPGWTQAEAIGGVLRGWMSQIGLVGISAWTCPIREICAAWLSGTRRRFRDLRHLLSGRGGRETERREALPEKPGWSCRQGRPKATAGSRSHAFETMRFTEHHLKQLEERFGVSSIEVVVPTHIHDDHTCGIPYLRRPARQFLLGAR